MGSAASTRLIRGTNYLPAWLAILGTLAAIYLIVPLSPLLEEISSTFVRSATVASVLGFTGFVMGFAFPIGVRIIAPTGEWAVQKMWGLNGAASIAGSAMAAFIGLTLGSRATLLAGVLCYVVVAISGVLASRTTPVAAAEPEPATV